MTSPSGLAQPIEHLADRISDFLEYNQVRHGRLWLWLREHGVTMEWYQIKTYGPWHWFHRHAQQLAESLTNLIVWLPIIWRDRDFDHAFLATMMIFKMRRMADHFERHALVERAPRHARELRTVATLLERIEADDYYRDDEPITWDMVLNSRQAQERDLKVACRILQRRLLFWWD